MMFSLHTPTLALYVKHFQFT